MGVELLLEEVYCGCYYNNWHRVRKAVLLKSATVYVMKSVHTYNHIHVMGSQN